jgi:thioredoxin-like negative regulator of GroEL
MELITSLKKYNDVINNKNTPVLIELYTPWCTKCKKIEQNLLEKSLNCKMYKLNIDDEPFIDEEDFHSITSLPSIWVYKQGKRFETTIDLIETILK